VINNSEEGDRSSCDKTGALNQAFKKKDNIKENGFFSFSLPQKLVKC